MLINGYTLIEPPTKGGMALVYKGQKGPFTRAFKMVRPDKASDNPKLVNQFLKEISLQSKLDHNNILKILDAYPFTPSSGTPYTVIEMEWLNGMDLYRFVTEKCPNGIPSSTVKKIALQVIDGMEYAHSRNILHLDIKPSNLFLSNDNHIKIIDFGIARVVGENAEMVAGGKKVSLTTEYGESGFKGTKGFASPEQEFGKKLDFTSDIFSFGKTLLFLCTGGLDPSIEIKDDTLNRIIDKCTMPKLKLRYQNFSEIRKEFESPRAGITQKKCIGCGRMIDNSAKFCSHCGKEQTPKPEPEQKRCPNCNSLIGENSLFCIKCGFDLTNQKQKVLIGYTCSICKKTTKAYSDGIVKYCNHCGATEKYLTKKYK